MSLYILDGNTLTELEDRTKPYYQTVLRRQRAEGGGGVVQSLFPKAWSLGPGRSLFDRGGGTLEV